MQNKNDKLQDIYSSTWSTSFLAYEAYDRTGSQLELDLNLERGTMQRERINHSATENSPDQ